MSEPAQVTKFGILDMQVCVPQSWTDERVKDFAEASYACGTTYGWHIRRQGDPALSGSPERAPCAERDGFVHVMLDA